MNYIEIAKELGIELNKSFKLNDFDGRFKLTERGLFCRNRGSWWDANYFLKDILKAGKENIVQTKNVLTEKERDWLSLVISSFRHRVISICKYEDCNDVEFIEISYYDFDSKGKFVRKMPFPGFKKGEYYEGMEPDKYYSLSELGL